MSTSIVDGTVAETVPGRSTKGFTVFKSIRFERNDGTSQTITKAVVSKAVADELQVGSKGRFYLFNAFDLRGVHGVRTPDGRSVYGFPTNNQKIFLFCGIANLLWIAVRLAADGEVPMLGLALLVFAVFGWVLMGKGRTEAKQQFDGDAGFTGAEPLTRPL